MQLILVRHGLPVRTDATSDAPLSEAGHEQARRVAEALAAERIDAIYSSTMQRAMETAQPLVALRGHALSCHDGICEFDRGTGRYIPMEELKRDDYPAWQAFVARGPEADIGEFQTAVVDTLESIIAANPSRNVAVFCHGGVINVWTAHVLGMAPRLFFEPAYTSIHRYLCAGTGERNLVSLNDTAHLK